MYNQDTRVFFAIINTQFEALTKPLLLTEQNLAPYVDNPTLHLGTNNNDKEIIHIDGRNPLVLRRYHRCIVWEGNPNLTDSYRYVTIADALNLARFIGQDETSIKKTRKRPAMPHRKKSSVFRAHKTSHFRNFMHLHDKTIDAFDEYNDYDDQRIKPKRNPKPAFSYDYDYHFRETNDQSWKAQNKCRYQWQKHQQHNTRYVKPDKVNQSTVDPLFDPDLEYISPSIHTTIQFKDDGLGEAIYRGQPVAEKALAYSPWYPQFGVVQLERKKDIFANGQQRWSVYRNCCLVPVNKIQHVPLVLIPDTCPIDFEKEWEDIELNCWGQLSGTGYDPTTWDKHHQPHFPSVDDLEMLPILQTA